MLKSSYAREMRTHQLQGQAQGQHPYSSDPQTTKKSGSTDIKKFHKTRESLVSDFFFQKHCRNTLQAYVPVIYIRLRLEFFNYPNGRRQRMTCHLFTDVLSMVGTKALAVFDRFGWDFLFILFFGDVQLVIFKTTLTIFARRSWLLCRCGSMFNDQRYRVLR